MNDVKKYHFLLRTLHWTMALIIIAMIFSGWYMVSLDPKIASNKYIIYNIHKSFGVIIILLLLARIITRLSTTIPALPIGIKNIEKKLSHIVHFILYVAMLLIPLSGYIMSDAGNYGVKLFTIELPDFLEKNKALAMDAKSFHSYAPYILFLIIILHIIGTIKHRYFDKKENDILNRML